MNQDQFLSLLRTVLKIAGTLLVSYGYVNDQQWVTVVSGLMILAPIIWDMIDKTKQATIAKVAAMKDVKGIVTTSAVATEAPSPKVVSTAAQIPATAPAAP